MNHLFKYILLILCSTLILSAQDDEEIDYDIDISEFDQVDYSDFPRATSQSDLEFRLLTIAEIDEDLFIRHDSDFKRLQPKASGISQPHYYDGPRPLVLYRKGVDEEGKEAHLPCGEISIPANSNQIILALKKTNDTYSGKGIDMSLRAQPLRSVRFINLTPANLVVLLNDQRETLKPQGEVITKFSSDKKQYFNFRIGARYEGQATLLYSKRYPFRGDMRQLLIGYVSNKNEPGKSPFSVLDHRDTGPKPRVILNQNN